MAKSTLSITFTQARKSLVSVGTVALRETVEVTVIGGNALIAEGLVIKVQDIYNQGQTVPIAQFPLAGNTWTSSGLNAKCDLIFNTTEAVAAFTNVQNLGFKTFNVLIYTTVTKALEANGTLSVMNFPSAVTADPITLDQTTSIAALDSRIDQLEAQATITPVYTDFTDLDFTDLSTNAKRNDAIRALLAKLQGT